MEKDRKQKERERGEERERAKEVYIFRFGERILSV
jgi:hypothetical protein